MKKKILLILLSITLLFSCTAKKEVIFEGTVLQDTQFDAVLADVSIENFNACGFDFGDSVNVEFENGLTLQDIPYYNGYYTRKGEPLICGYPTYERIAITKSSGGLWTGSGLEEGDGVTITMNEKGKYLVNQETFSQSYTSELSDFKDEVTFANFRSMAATTLKENYLYRGASPCDNIHGRVEVVNKLLKENGIKYVISLSDSEEEFNEYEISDDLYIKDLYKNNKISFLDMSADYSSESYRKSVVEGFRQIIKNDGPFYIHCTEGKDRTGFVCFVLEAITGASYDEMLNDYMKTYDNYFGITKESDQKKYEAIINLYFGSFTDFIKEPYKQGCINYLLDSGMEESEINTLISKISK